MRDYQQQLNDKLQAGLSDKYISLQLEVDTLVMEVSPLSLTTVCQALHDEYGFKLLVDLCGVDYAAFGQQNWETDGATAQGFSRGVFDFDDGEDLSVAVDADMDRRFCVVYQLLNISDNLRLRVKCFPENTSFPMVASAVPIWECANWFEREAFDLFGIVFEGHPDLRRILTDYGFVGHPLRKDFPLVGKVEMYYDAIEHCVRYRPVTLENRVNVPRVIR